MAMDTISRMEGLNPDDYEDEYEDDDETDPGSPVLADSVDYEKHL